jgi:hypothetical protein
MALISLWLRPLRFLQMPVSSSTFDVLFVDWSPPKRAISQMSIGAGAKVYIL